MTHEWAALRALPVELILDVLGVQREGEHFLCPRYPGCCALFVVHDDPEYGVSVRCAREGCLLGPMDAEDAGWNWPEHALALHEGIPVEEARVRLLQAAADGRSRRESYRGMAREGGQSESRPSRARARAQLAARFPEASK